MNTPTYEHVSANTVCFWAWVDSSVWPLAFPFTAQMFVDFLYTANGWLGGESQGPAFAPLHMFFVCMGGALVMTWVVARLLHPVGILACVDGWARAWVGGLILYFVFMQGLPPVLLLFVFTELAGAVVQLYAVYGKARVSQVASP